jgi:hypothetical protein
VVRLIICNAPSWFWTVWGMIARVLPESTRDKIVIIGDSSGLDQYIDRANRPKEYSGDDVPLGQSAEFIEYVEVAREWERQGYELFLTMAEIEEEKNRVRSNSKMNGGVMSATNGAQRSSSFSEARPDGDWNSDSDSDEWEVVSENDEDNFEQQQDQSIYGWIRNGFKKPDQAYLGDKNCFRYDEELGQWRMASPSGTPARKESARGRTRTMSVESSYKSPSYGASTPSEIQQRTKEQLEEHGLVLAIQAAHLANATTGGESGGISGGQRDKRSSWQQHTRMDSTDNSNRNEDNRPVRHGEYRSSVLQSRAILAMLCGAHFVATCTLSGLRVFLPVVLLTTRKAGGFGLRTAEVGMSLSICAIFALQYHVFLRWRARRLAQLSPTRAMQTGAMLLTAALMTLSIIGSYRVQEPTSVLSFDALEGSAIEKDESGVLADADHIVVPGLILAVAATSAHYLRQATSCLLQVALDQHLLAIPNASTPPNHWTEYLTAPNLVPNVGFAGDTIGPIAVALVMGMAHRSSLPYPMDAGFIIPFSACCVCAIYIMSFMLSLTFKTDFGDVVENLEYSRTAAKDD